MKINVDLLKDYRSDFSNEKSNFNSSSYGTFSSSYINRCSDSYIIRMKDELRKLYQDIEKAYKNIDSWWGDYNNDIESLERALSNDGRSGAIKASSVRSCVDALPTLKNYSLSFSGIINLNFEKAVPTLDLESHNLVFSNNIHDVSSNRTNVIDSFFSFLSDTGAVVSEGWNWFGDKALESIEYINDIGHEYYNLFNDVLPWFQNAASTVWDVVESVGATITIFCQSLVEGILQFGEAIIDFAVLASVGVSSFVTGLIDGGQAIYGAITGNEWSSVTKEMWEGTMGFVSNQYVTGWFDSLYQNTGYGKWVAQNAWGFDTVRSVGSGIGYVAGVVVLTIATLGAGSAVAAGGSATASTAATTTHMAVTATAAGIGKGTQDTWANGAGLLEGLTAGIVTGLWEGLQFYVGGKIGGLEIFGADGFLKSIGSSKIGTKILNGLARVILDGLDGGVEGFVQPLISGIYQDGYYDTNGNYIEFTENDNFLKRYAELFDDAGGLANVGIQTLIGGGSSLIGEVFDLSKILRESSDADIGEKINVDNSNQNLTLDDLKYNQVDSLTSAKALVESNLRRYVYTDTNKFEGLNQSILNSGLYHFTDAADAILESGYIKATGEISLGSFGYIDPGLLGYLNSKSYGNAKAFFFAGVPEVGAFATNLDTIPLKTTAIKVQPNVDIVNSSKLKIRNLDDGAITYDGRFDLTGSQASKEYFCVFKENDELVYKPVSKDVFDNYENTAEGKVLADFLKIKKNVKTIKDDYLVGLSMKNTNAKVGNGSSKISGISTIENLDPPHYLNDGFEVADYFNDPKQYLFQKLKSLAETSNDSSFLEKYKELVKKDPRTINEPRFKGKGMKLATVDISEDDLLDFLNTKGVFTEQDYEIYRRLKNNEVKFSQTEKDAIFIFTAWFSPELAAYNRNAVTNFDGHRIDGMNRLQIEHHLNNQIDLYNRVYGKNMSHMTLDEFNSIMDKITQRTVLKEDLVVYRGANSLFSDGGELDFESIKPGQTFNDKSHISTSVIPTHMVNKHKYILEIKLPKDTSFGYIETVTGVARYNQQELLLGRNNNFKITDYPEIVEIDGVEHYKVKVELVPSVLEPDLDITVELEPPTVELEPPTVELELPNSNLETLDITQPLDAKVNILDNNQISEEMRAKILDDFKKMMRNGKRSNYEILEMLMEMAEKKGDEGFRILQAITRIKSIIPELEFSANAYEDGSWWRCDDFNDEYKLQLQERYIDWKNYETLAHELGHCLFDMISGAPLPDNWDDMIVRAKINSSNNGTLKLFKQEYDNLYRDIYWNQAYPKFKDSIMIQYGYTEKQYREFLTEQFKQISQERGKLRQTLIASGLTFEQAFKMTDEDIIDIEKLVDEDIKRQISNFNEQIWRTQYGGYVALNDMIDAVSNGDWGDVYGGHSHGSKHYLKSPKNFPLHELVADFTSLKLNNEEAALKQFKEIFGTEFYDYLDSIYNSFLEFGKRYGGV